MPFTTTHRKNKTFMLDQATEQASQSYLYVLPGNDSLIEDYALWLPNAVASSDLLGSKILHRHTFRTIH